jgi:hypothetical protein
MPLRVVLSLSLLLNMWLISTLVRVENERYAMQIGMCWNATLKLPDPTCVKAASTRTGWYWHAFYALKG